MNQERKMFKNFETLQTMVDGRVQQVPQQL